MRLSRPSSNIMAQQSSTINTPTPEHMRALSWSSLGRVLLVGILLMEPAYAELNLLWLFGWQHSLTQMAWFFTKAALMTFGGAYAVLAVCDASRGS